jgi:hypothetical protein
MGNDSFPIELFQVFPPQQDKVNKFGAKSRIFLITKKSVSERDLVKLFGNKLARFHFGKKVRYSLS